jgi:trigger factor
VWVQVPLSPHIAQDYWKEELNLKIETQPREDHQVNLIVEVDAEQMDVAKRKAARKISERSKIPGFRPGKAPYDVVRRFYGESAITEEAVEVLVDQIYPDVLKESGIQPAAAGSLENIEKLDPPTFKFLVPLAPTVDLGDYKSVRKPYDFTLPGDEKVDEAIENLRSMYSKTEDVDREINEGDFVLLDIKGVSEDKDLADLTRASFPVFIRKDEKEADWPFPGFGMELVGKKAGETVTIEHTFPKDHENESFKGLLVDFEIAVKSVRGVTLPELNDEFAKSVGVDTVEDLRKRIKENLDAQAKADYDDIYFTEVIDMIKTGATIKYPPQVLEHESEHVLDELKRRLSDQHLDLETYIKMQQTDMDKFLADEVRPTAQRRLERSLLIEEISRQEKIELDQTKLEEAFQQNWSSLAATDQKFSKLTKAGTRASKELVDAVVVDTANRMMVSRVLDRIKAIATGQGDITEIPEPAPDQENSESTTEGSINESFGDTEKPADLDDLNDAKDNKTADIESPEDTK